jgi:hypothetical protein
MAAVRRVIGERLADGKRYPVTSGQFTHGIAKM